MKTEHIEHKNKYNSIRKNGKYKIKIWWNNIWNSIVASIKIKLLNNKKNGINKTKKN